MSRKKKKNEPTYKWWMAWVVHQEEWVRSCTENIELLEEPGVLERITPGVDDSTRQKTKEDLKSLLLDMAKDEQLLDKEEPGFFETQLYKSLLMLAEIYRDIELH
jgi:hypothetical protein